MLFLKVMYELYERLPELRTKSSYKLAEFQRRIVKPVLAKLLAHRGALLISPTGTGKSVMAGHVAAQLAQQHVQRIIVVCPNKSLAHDWRATMRRYGRSIDIVTHGILQNKGTKTSEKQRRLLEIISNPQETDLVIVDECHHFRNLGTDGQVNLRKLLKPDNEAQRPYCLLLTATPISTGPENIDVLLNLITTNKTTTFRSVHQLNDIPNAVNVNLPSILKNFGVVVKGHGKLALRYGDELLYFPAIQFKTVRYPSTLDDIVDAIVRLPLRFEFDSDHSKGTTHAAQLILGGDTWAVGPKARSTRELALLRILLARRAESGPSALTSSLDRLLAAIERGDLKPVQPELLCEGLVSLRSMINLTAQDTKLQELKTLLRQHPATTKILIFSESTDTVNYLYTHLTQDLPQRRMQALTGETKNRKTLLKRFAPIGQKVPREEQGSPICILIASDAIAEGENLQDATVVINYDLTWTPLRLIQRIGRVDRPTQKPRKVFVYNFYPDSKRYEEVVKLWSRLEVRSNDVEVLSRARVIGDHERIPEQVDAQDTGLFDILQQNGDYYQFLDNLLPTSRFMETWSSATEEELQKARELPNNVRAGKHGREAGYYVLIRHEDRNYSLFLPSGSEQPVLAPQEQTHEFFLDNYVRAERDTPSIPIPSTFDDEVQQLVAKWATQVGYEPEALTVIAAEYSSSE